MVLIEMVWEKWLNVQRARYVIVYTMALILRLVKLGKNGNQDSDET
jgi:hypothetical protein